MSRRPTWSAIECDRPEGAAGAGDETSSELLATVTEKGGAMRRVVIMGAGGRDFHDFNVVFRSNRDARVVAFTAAQIPGIADRVYPAALPGAPYPQGIPIRDEQDLAELIRRELVDEVVLASSDLSHEEVMHKASLVLAA